MSTQLFLSRWLAAALVLLLAPINATSGEGVRADAASATPAMPAVRAPIPRALPRASHQGGITVTATSAQIQGRELTKPTFNPMLVPKRRATCVGR